MKKPLIFSFTIAFSIFALSSISCDAQWGKSQSAADVVEKVLPSVVNISAVTLVTEYSYYGRDVEDFFRFFGMPTPRKRPRTSLGSGFIIAKKGEVLTNNHVVERADEVYVILADGTKHKAKIIGRDSKLDIALLQIEAKKIFQPMKWGDANKARIAEEVYAIGNPFGLSHSVSKGIISAKHRSLGAGPFDDFLQTDAAINFGNSGGPLINSRGEVIGINTAIRAKSEGLGFAIPVNMVIPKLDDLRVHHRILRPWLGISGRTFSGNIAGKKREGVGITRIVKDGPAHKAGLTVGDLILDLNGKDVPSSNELQRKLEEFKLKERIAIRIIREGRILVRTITLGAYPEEDKLPRGYQLM